ncbi:MAG: insulinase family protein [Candidatus Eremiobacteraeota bacterium]|nr:insulinase family protein [Candidatus Eremiobacteraeota bacterium]
MRRAGALAACLAAVVLGASPGPSFQTVKLPGGGTGIVRPLAGAPIAAVQLWFRAPSIGFEASPQPGIANLAAYAVAASVPLTGTPLGTLVARAGGRFGISVYPRTIAISALVPASQAASVLRAMSADYFTPVLTQAGLTQAIAAVRQDARLRALASPEETLRDAVFGALFTGGPNHYSPTGDEADPSALGLDAVRAFATRAFRASNATIVLTGAVNADLAGAAVEGRGEGGVAEELTSGVAQVEKTPQPLTRKGPVAGFGYAWPGPPIKNEEEATALDFIADYLFNPDTGTVARAVAGTDVSINAQFVTYYDPGVLFVEATGSRAPFVRAAIDAALAAMRTPLDPKLFVAARNAFEYHVTSDVSTPLSLADNFGWYASEGNVEYAPGADLDGGRYVRSVRALTPQSVAATAAKYLSGPPAVVMLAVGSLNAPPPTPAPKR